MNRLALGAAVLALAGVAGPLCAAEPTNSTAPTVRAPWYKRWFGIGAEPPKMAPPPPKRDPAQEAATARARAEAALDRRMRVCDELRRVADETKNNDLWTKADDLERQAMDVYKQQTAHLPCSRLMPSQDERALDRHLGSTTAAASDRLTTPAISVPSRGAQASAIREVRP